CPHTEPVETLLPGEVLLRVEGCALGAAECFALAEEGVCPGGASVGTVVAAASGLDDVLGKRMLVPEVLPCGECTVCQRGRAPACPAARKLGTLLTPGALATHLRVPSRCLVTADGELPPGTEPWMLATLAGPCARLYHAMVRAGLGPGELAIFIGDNPTTRVG